MRTAFVGIAFVLVSCARDTPHPSGTVVSSGSSSPSAASPSAAASSSATPSAPLPVVITNLASGEFEIEAKQPTSLALAATLERLTEDGGWSPMDGLDLGKGYRLVESCTGTAPASCVDVAPSKALFPVPWQGFGCSAQCNGTCRANSWEGEGTFRLVVRSCDGAASATGPAFNLPGPDTTGLAFDRWKATTDVTTASVMRLELPGTKWNPADPQEASLAGFGMRRGTQSPLDHDTTDALVKALRNPHGFDDQIAKRCAVNHLVGFRLDRTLPTTGAPHHETVDVAIDFVCQKLFVARAGAGGRPPTVLATHFDPSRAAFLAIAKKALPGDGEISSLK